QVAIDRRRIDTCTQAFGLELFDGPCSDLAQHLAVEQRPKLRTNVRHRCFSGFPFGGYPRLVVLSDELREGRGPCLALRGRWHTLLGSLSDDLVGLMASVFDVAVRELAKGRGSPARPLNVE